jgi:hypothetical protein
MRDSNSAADQEGSEKISDGYPVFREQELT